MTLCDKKGLMMPFDIKRLADIETAEDEYYEYQDELLNLFANSPEGQARLQADGGMAFWARSLIDYGYNYVGVPLHEMDEGTIEELLTEVFPRKISLSAPEDADEGLPAMIAFWEYLKREYRLENADEILACLRSVKPRDFKAWMNDSSRFGMAKSFFSMAQSEGFDLTNEQESNAFMNLYNARLLSSGVGGGVGGGIGGGIGLPLPGGDDFSPLGDDDFEDGDLPMPSGPGEKSKKERDKAKRLRKIAKASRKKNRQRK